MSYYVTQIFLIKGNNLAIEKVSAIIDVISQSISDIDEIIVQFRKLTNNIGVINCFGRRTTFNNVYCTIKKYGVDVARYIDYTDGTFEGSSNLGKYIIVREDGYISIPIACANTIEELREQLRHHFRNNKELYKLVADDSIDTYDMIENLNEAVYEYYKYLECGDFGVSGETDFTYRLLG